MPWTHSLEHKGPRGLCDSVQGLAEAYALPRLILPALPFARVASPDHAVPVDSGPTGFLEPMFSPHIDLSCTMEKGLPPRTAVCSWKPGGYVAGFHSARDSVTQVC